MKPIDRSPKGQAIELGLAISGALLPPGQWRELPELAAWCGCSKQMIHTIEKRALRKVRMALETLRNHDDDRTTRI
jgi:hypothetical protein